MEKRDEELFTNYQLGDQDAMEILFGRYKKPMMNYALRILQNRADAEDVVSEVFLVLFSGKYQSQEGAKFSTWLYTVARNACITRIRKRGRLTSLWFKSKKSDEYDQWDVEDPNTNVGEDLSNKETAWHLKRAISKLPLEQKEALILREYHDLSYQEISEILEVSLANVKILIFRARENLKDELSSFFKDRH